MRKVIIRLVVGAFVLFVLSCKGKVAGPGKEAIAGLKLDSGKAISCGPADEQFGAVEFENSCSRKERASFNRGIELLHSFEYEEAEKAFATVIYDNPGCAMAYWVVAMCNYHLLWTPPTAAKLKKGAPNDEVPFVILVLLILKPGRQVSENV
jgi:hypothetical protein